MEKRKWLEIKKTLEIGDNVIIVYSQAGKLIKKRGGVARLFVDGISLFVEEGWKSTFYVARHRLRCVERL